MPALNRTATVLVNLLLVMIAAPANAQETQQRGRLHVVWDVDNGAAGASEYYLVDGTGRPTRILPGTGVTAAGLLEMDRRMVDVRTAPPTTDAIPAARLLDARAADTGHAMMLDAATQQQYNFVTLLCRFADEVGPPPISRSEIERAHGSTYPGVQQYFAELSWDAGIMAGSHVTEWYMLPRNRSTYITTYGTDFGALARDCTAAADADVHFPDFFGINLQFSGGLSIRPVAPYDTLSFGGSWSLNLDGESRSWGMTWLSGNHARNYVVLTHEIGHAIGWPHSSGEYGNEYDSAWDIMSRGYLRWEPPHGWLGVHTIAWHKDVAGWVPDARRWTPQPGTAGSALLARTALPSSDGYLIARIPANGISYYTVEARRIAGHDQPLPAEAVVLHRVMFNRAFVVDVDNNGDPNDDGARWTPGEVFHDSINGVTVAVDSATDAGFHVNITRGWRLDLVATGMGRIDGAPSGWSTAGPVMCDAECTVVMDQRGATLELNAVPADGWRFVEWRGACSGNGSCIAYLSGNRRIEAVFASGAVVRADWLAPAVMGAEYSDTLRAEGTSFAQGWSVLDGAFPPGLVLDALTGALTGIPTQAGTFVLTVATQTPTGPLETSLSMDVSKPVLGLNAVIDQLFGGTSLSTDEVRFLDLLGNRNGTLDIGDVRRWLIDARHLTEVERSTAASVIGREGGSQ